MQQLLTNATKADAIDIQACIALVVNADLKIESIGKFWGILNLLYPPRLQSFDIKFTRQVAPKKIGSGPWSTKHINNAAPNV